MRKVHCAYCGKQILENQKCVRHKGFTGFFCNCTCLALNEGIVIKAIVSDELVQEDFECSGFGWDE